MYVLASTEFNADAHTSKQVIVIYTVIYYHRVVDGGAGVVDT